MSRAHARRQAVRLLGLGIAAVFVLGSASGPLRACLSHPGHTPGEHDVGKVAASHGAPEASSHTQPSQREGCTCLGQCSLEHEPLLPGAGPPAVANVPTAPKMLASGSERSLARLDRFGLPLARPPPSVV